MCAVCGNGEPEGRWNTPPATPERMDEVRAWQEQNILDVGHTVTSVGNFAYSEGRSMFGYPELLVTGAIGMTLQAHLINQVAELEANGKINVLSLADGQPVELDGFGCLLRLVVADPHAAEMLGAIRLSGEDVLAVQIVWPDAAGVWPDEIGFVHGPDAQPIYAKER